MAMSFDTFIPCLDATEVWSTPVMNIPSPYSIPPLIINPRLSSGLRLKDTWVQKMILLDLNVNKFYLLNIIGRIISS